MRETVGPEMGVKASGGVRTYDDAIAMLKAGANRLGCSSTMKIVSGVKEDEHKCVNCGGRGADRAHLAAQPDARDERARL